MSKIRIPAMLLLFSLAALLEAIRLTSLSSISSRDIWWHLSTGLWILQNQGLPHSGILSQSSMLPWRTSNWAFEVLLAGAYTLLGLRAIPLLMMFLKVGLAVVTFLLAGGLRGKFGAAVALSAVAQYVLGSVAPGPTYFSILFFAVELFLLDESRKNGAYRRLYWLPVLFCVWANFDVQFLYGIAVLVLLSVTFAIEGEFDGFKIAGLAGVLSCMASLVSPNFYHSYGTFFSILTSGANKYLPDFLAMKFHQAQDYMLLLLLMAAFLTLGIRKSRDWFQISLLIGCAAASFYSQRDIWLVTLASVMVIGNSAWEKSVPQVSVQNADTNLGHLRIAMALAVVTLIVAFVIRVPRDHRVLLEKVAESYPVAASDYIRQRQLPQPLFNPFEWGGFLTWYLPEYPVAIDGRTDLYGDDAVVGYSKVMNADARYTDFTPMAQAQTLLLQKKSVMGEALMDVQGFKVEYSDDVSVILTKSGESLNAATAP
jgi:hypothetical protein